MQRARAAMRHAALSLGQTWQLRHLQGLAGFRIRARLLLSTCSRVTMSKMLIVGSGVLIAVATLLFGIGGYVVTSPLFMTLDPVTGAANDPAAYGNLCLRVALAFASAAVGFLLLGSPRQSALNGAAAGALASVILCALWIARELFRGTPLSQLWGWSMLVSVTLAAGCAMLGSGAAMRLRRRREW